MFKFFSSYTKLDWLLVFTRCLIGVIFIFSGIVKLIPIEPFELKFVELGVANWTYAPYFARFIIGIELLLGALLIVNIKPKLTSYATLGLLLFFTIYLMMDILYNGNEGNCGCFGTLIKMTPLESIVKNMAMIPLVLVLIFLTKRELNYKLYILLPFILITSFALPFILYPVDNVESYINANTETVNYPFPIKSIPDFSIAGKRIDLSKGSYILAFMSLNCPHCKKAAYKLYILNKQKKLPNVYFIFIGMDEMVSEFVKETKADFPYYIYNEKEFFDIAGSSVPKILVVKEGIVKAKFDNVTLTEESLDKALNTIP